MASVPVYRGRFGVRQAERLLWRAGFGPRPGQARSLARRGLRHAVYSLTRPHGKARLNGPRPTDGDGNPIAPYDAWGHDVLWWLDRMVRSSQPGLERMALVWHDWFATGDVGSQRFSVNQAKLFRLRGLGSFERLLLDVTTDPAMLIWLSGIYNSKWSPNENYGRELMELFTLGASDDSDYPYSEDDVREQARALTGWRADWRDDVGYTNFRFDRSYHDAATKSIFGRSGNFDWRDSCKLCIKHGAHAPYFVERLWKHFIAEPPDARTKAALIARYRASGHQVRPVVEAILMHPALYEGPSLVKPPIVLIAGLLRARGRGVDTDAWSWVSDLAGMRLFRPPNVSGWDEDHWLDTSTFRGRWVAAGYVTRDEEIATDGYPADEGPREAVNKALHYWAEPSISALTRDELEAFARAVEDAATADWQQGSYRALRQNALRTLIATSPDLQAC